MIREGFGFHQLGYLLIVSFADDLSILATHFALLLDLRGRRRAHQAIRPALARQ
jgi:hypothetical protein